MSASEENNLPYRLGTTSGMPEKPETPPVVPKKASPRNGHLPERYTVKHNVDEQVLISLEAPNLNVHIEAGLSFSGSIARKSPGGTIFLDGVAQCEPFMDHERQVYNLDHHENCVRAFTFSTCEQALVMYMKGLELQGREWHIFANEPDLDTIMAIWILLNHARIGAMDINQRRILFALVRYEGIVDALGLELKELSALPPDLMRKIQRVIDHLRSDEIALKKEGRWEQTDYLLYTASILHKVDQIFFKASDFKDYQGIEELSRIDLNDQRIAAVVEADMGIYEIEPHLNKIYGNRLGVVFLKKGPNTYTVRQMDLFMPITLDEIYERLNFVDSLGPFPHLYEQMGRRHGYRRIAEGHGNPADTRPNRPSLSRCVSKTERRAPGRTIRVKRRPYRSDGSLRLYCENVLAPGQLVRRLESFGVLGAAGLRVRPHLVYGRLHQPDFRGIPSPMAIRLDKRQRQKMVVSAADHDSSRLRRRGVDSPGNGNGALVRFPCSRSHRHAVVQRTAFQEPGARPAGPARAYSTQ